MTTTNPCNGHPTRRLNDMLLPFDYSSARPRPRLVGRAWRGVLVGVASALMLLGIATLSQTAAQDVRFFRIGTGAAGGLFFPIGGLIASAISRPPGSRDCDEGGSCGVQGLIAVAQSTDGGEANIRGIVAKEIESGFARGDMAWRARREKGPFAGGSKKVKKPAEKSKLAASGGAKPGGKFESIRAIANLYPEALYVVVAADSKLKSLADLKRKTLSLGPEGSHSALSARMVLDAYGLTGRKVKTAFHEPEEAMALLAEGKLDAVFVFEPLPSPRIHKLAETFAIRLLPVGGAPAAALVAKHSWFSHTYLQGDIYHDVKGVDSLKIGTLWLVSSAVDDGLVYEITRSLWHKNTISLIARGHAQGRSINPAAALTGLPVPLHKGAARYYKETGLLKPVKQKSSDAKTPEKKPAN